MNKVFSVIPEIRAREPAPTPVTRIVGTAPGKPEMNPCTVTTEDPAPMTSMALSIRIVLP